MVAPAQEWIRTVDREPADGEAIEWPAGDRVVFGYRMGPPGAGLWVEPTRGDGPEYHRRPALWRPATRFRPKRPTATPWSEPEGRP